MSTALIAPPPTKQPRPTPDAGRPPSPPRRFADWHAALGGVPLDRVLFDPPPGTAVPDDVERVRRETGALAELVNNTLVEKAVALRESEIGGLLSARIIVWADFGRKGRVTPADGFIRMTGGNIRAPDVAYFPIETLENGLLPAPANPSIAPALAVEVLSPSNTAAEIRLKMQELFASGTRLVWIVDPATRSVRVHTTPDDFHELFPGDTLDGGGVLPGFSVAVADLFPAG